MSEVEDCFQKGLLKRTEKSKSLALQDLRQAEFFLNEAFDLLSLKKKEMTALALYNAVFHSARALLFKDGIKEKSHYCLQKYLEENYESKGLLDSKEISLFDVLRGLRQEIQYDVARVEFDEDLNELYNKAEEFFEKIKTLVKCPLLHSSQSAGIPRKRGKNRLRRFDCN